MTDAAVPPIDDELVARLLAEQFPRWSGLPIRAADPQGWDNRTFRVGDALSVRLPSAAGYVPAVEKEQRVLPYLAPRIGLPVPEPVGLGRPGCGYPFPWSARRWIDGRVAVDEPRLDLERFASDVGAVLRRLRVLTPGPGPVAGAHSFHRGEHPSVYAREVDAALARLGDAVDQEACRAVWERATASSWRGPGVWFHGDVSPTNLLVEDGRLSAVIDFGTCGVGDPACDVVLAWTFLDGPSRAVFRRAVDLDPATWDRGRGWALWKALIMLAGSSGPGERTDHERVLAAVLNP